MKFAALLLILLPTLAMAQSEEARRADKIFNTPAGHYVRIVGAPTPLDAVVLPSPIGDAVNIPSIPANGLCNVILNAALFEVIDPITSKVIREIPIIPELAYAFGKVSWPKKIGGSEDGGTWYWNGLFRGGACVTSADSSAYVASSLQELFPLVAHKPKNCRLLRAQITETQQIEGQDVEVNITVSACDPRVRPGQDLIFMPHSWAGRYQDLNYRRFKAGVFSDRVKPGKGK